MTYKVLWIDDNPSQAFIDDAFESYDLDIVNKISYKSGIEWLRENKNSCFAVILDVNCKIDDCSVNTSMDVFTDYHRDVLELCQNPVIPWFVYTAGDFEGAEQISRIIPSRHRNWDLGRKYYNKPADRKELLTKVRKAVEHRGFYDILIKYEDILEKYSDVRVRLINILTVVENGVTDDAAIMTDIRKVLEAMVPYLKEHGLLPKKVRKLSAVGYFMKQLSHEAPMIMPKFIVYGFMSCCEVCQNGSHLSNVSSANGNNNLIVDEMLTKDKMPYLIRSTVYSLLNFMSWASKLPSSKDEIDALRNIIESYNITLEIW